MIEKRTRLCGLGPLSGRVEDVRQLIYELYVGIDQPEVGRVD